VVIRDFVSMIVSPVEVSVIVVRSDRSP